MQKVQMLMTLGSMLSLLTPIAPPVLFCIGDPFDSEHELDQTSQRYIQDFRPTFGTPHL